MKDAGWIVAALLFGIIAGFGLGNWYAKGDRESFASHPALQEKPVVTDNHAPTVITADTNRPPSANEWQDYHSTREKTLQDNPDLAAEYKALLAEIDHHQKDVEDAMAKADPKVAPIVAKLAKIREQNLAHATAATK